MAEIQEAEEKRLILNSYRGLLRACKFPKDNNDKKLIRKAFNIAVDAHKDMRRKSGEPYILHPIAVARIATEEIGLGTTAVVCALLHDVVEDTELTLEDIEGLFGPQVAKIIDGLTKIEEVFDQTISIQAENFKKILLTLSEDVRVILIKLADRLHNMRTLGAMADHKQRKIASETLYLYAPLAHRLGVYNVKSELEDLSLKFTEPNAYAEIKEKLKKTKAVRNRFINRFLVPIKKSMDEMGLDYTAKARTKSIYSIWNKMQKQDIPFEEVYDIFAVRIIISSNREEEKADCWKVYSVVTDFYAPNPDRLRDWISTPKGNGYESLHTTVMSPTGKWVEVQIRTERMDDVAEKGFAAHWKYKESATENAIDEWISKVRELLENPDRDAMDFIDDFKLSLFTKEIFVFTPKGEVRNLPANATALDFAFEIHTQVGSKCLGAKVNNKLVPLSHELKSGDQIEIITSNKQKPKEDWLNFVVTTKAKSKIKSVLKEEKRAIADEGKETLTKKMRQAKVDFNDNNIQKLVKLYRLPNELELYYRIGMGTLNLSRLDNIKKEAGKITTRITRSKKEKSLQEVVSSARGKSDMLVLGDNMENIDYKLSPCCSPIPGDNVFGFITINDGIKIHRINCPNAVQLMSNYAYRIVQARWFDQEQISFLAGLKVTGIDDVGIVNNITRIISSELNVNMRSISFESLDGTFEGTIMVFVYDTSHLDNLIKKLENVEGVDEVKRIDSN